jgi:signal peptidase I
MEVSAGDHLFVDRLTYNFRPPERGEIVVFETEGIPDDARDAFLIPDNEFYIKRLVGLGGETLSLSPDYDVLNVPQSGGATIQVGHLVVNGQPLSESTPHFDNLYSFPDAKAGAKALVYHRNHYYGHALLPNSNLAPGVEYQVQPGYYFVMGDNTMDSLDSRYWGDFPSQYIIGKSFFVYWPLTRRFGWDNH